MRLTKKAPYKESSRCCSYIQQRAIAKKHSLLSRYCWLNPNIGGFLSVVR